MILKGVEREREEEGREYTIVLYKIPMMFFRCTALAENDSHSYSRNNWEPSTQLTT